MRWSPCVIACLEGTLGARGQMPPMMDFRERVMAGEALQFFAQAMMPVATGRLAQAV